MTDYPDDVAEAGLLTARVHDKILFEDRAGQPIPRLPYDPDGMRREADGKCFMSLHQAARHFGLRWYWLWDFWFQTLIEFLTPAQREAFKPRKPIEVDPFACDGFTLRD